MNGTKITVPCNTVIQMPANTITWADFASRAAPVAHPEGGGYPSFEMRVGRQHRRRQAHRGPAVRLAAGGQRRQLASSPPSTTPRGTSRRHRRPGQPGDRADQRPERPLRPRPEPGPAVQRRRPEPDHPCRHRLPDVRAAHRPGSRRTIRSARRPTGPTCAGDRQRQDRARRRRRLPQLQRRRHRRRRRAASSPRRAAGQAYCSEFVMPSVAARAAATRTPASRPRSRSATRSPSPAP